MAATKKAAAKGSAQDLKTLSAVELQKELSAALDKRAKIEFQHKVAPLKNPLEIRHLRREIARLKTHLHQKEAAK